MSVARLIEISRGAVGEFGRSCLPGRTSRIAATSVHVNRQYRSAVSLARRTRFACGESPFRQKGPTLTTIRDHALFSRRFLGCVGATGMMRRKRSRFRRWSRTQKDLEMEACARSRVAAKLRNLCFRSSSSSPSFRTDCEVTQRKQPWQCFILKRSAVAQDSDSRVLGH